MNNYAGYLTAMLLSCNFHRHCVGSDVESAIQEMGMEGILAMLMGYGKAPMSRKEFAVHHAALVAQCKGDGAV